MAKRKLVLNAAAMRVVEKNDRGIVTYRKRYKRGNVVDVSHIDPAHVEALVRAGRLVDPDDVDEPEEAPETPDAPEGSGDGTEGQEEGDEETEPEEDFDSYDYPTLQRLAKERTGDGSGGKQDLLDRLKAHAAADDDNE